MNDFTKGYMRGYKDAQKEALRSSPNGEAQPAVALEQRSVSEHLEPVAYGMWDTMLGYGGRMMMVRLDKGQDGCTVPLYTAPAHQNVNVDDIGVPVGVGGRLTTTSSQPEQEPVAWSHAGAMPPEQEVMKEAAYNLAPWLSAALDDPKVCKEYKVVINAWFDAAMPTPQRTWVGLTPFEIDAIIEDAIHPMDALLQTMDKLKEKNT